MAEGLIVVLDVGKTVAKLSLWTRGAALLERRTRPNARIDAGGYVALDAAGIEAWLAGTLAGFVRRGRIDAIVPVAHGAAAAILRDGRLALPPLDYEEPVPAAERANYDAGRDAFGDSGSPALPDGLNLGVQLHRLERLHPGLLDAGAAILTWPQYWAWLLSGVAATEATSLGCHTDLWNPAAAAPSAMAARRGWADRLAPLRAAGEVLGTIVPGWAERTGLPATTRIYCGLHDSNAALLAARGFPEIAGREATVLSTGTWFVAMRSPAPGTMPDLRTLPEERDCLVNVDMLGRPVPSARFMGGREIELLTGADALRIDASDAQQAILRAAPAVVLAGAMIVPTMAPGCGAFPDRRGGWRDMPADPAGRAAAVSLYAALVADVSLGLIGARERILVEGRFAGAETFVRALATLRPEATIFASGADADLSYGALRLIDPALPPPSTLATVVPLPFDLDDYRRRWRTTLADGA